ncbi:hypothetical protein D9615_004633 [Tricholomella constricta]|uniref:FAD/NAD(P)-binding domain-containing protein n=1 Tax=Tricholomella constricta TaxID=117010 RepID=A0A8H5HBT0_9AGAR|nr:hypothetical protein D9615_004633 [Tricholomella constricta]
MATGDPVLPSLDRLNAKVSESASAAAIAQDWLSAFSESNAHQNTDAAEGLFLADSYWRDILALTSDIRSLEGWRNIRALLDSRRSHLSSLRLLQDPHNLPVIDSPFPDLTYLQFTFEFETPIGQGSGIGRLVPGADEKWRAFTIFTCLDSLRDHVEKVGVNRSTTPIIEPWEALRNRQVDFIDEHPQVLIIGGGQGGLEVAARLKQLDVPTLVIERNARIGDSWRNRYDSLCLHDTVWYDHPPYMPFPSSWPVYCSAGKLANFLEAYAEMLELSVWTSSEIQSTTWDDSKKTWSVTILRGGKETRDFTVKHLVFTPGFGGGIPNMPNVANQDTFKGKVYHSSAFKSAREFVGKKAVIVGACNSGHDIAQDFSQHGIDVTMYQRSSTYVISAKAIAGLLGGRVYKEGANLEHADRVNASLTYTVTKLLHKRITPYLAQTVDKDILDELNKAGFKTNLGPEDAGIFPLLLTRGGGYYIDTGGSKEIIDGKIKLKTGSAIKSFNKNGLEWEDGSTLDADVIVFATGYGDAGDVVKAVCGPSIADQLLPVWGLDQEGELNSTWKSSGHEGLWIGVGNLAMCRFYSGVLALQIKASLEGILPSKYLGPQ